MAKNVRPSYVCCGERPALVYGDLVHLLDETGRELGQKPAHIFRFPENEAGELKLSRRVVSFQEMAANSLAVAASMVKLGIKPGDRIAIAIRNCPEWLYVDYACLRIKVLLFRLPINILNEKMFIRSLEKYNCCALVVDKSTASKLSSFLNSFLERSGSCTENERAKCLKWVFTLDAIPQKSFYTIADLIKMNVDSHPVLRIQETIDPEETAIILATSGSTDEPKCVAYSHFSFFNKLFGGPRMLICTDPEGVTFNDRPFSWIGGSVYLPIFCKAPMVYLNTSLLFDEPIIRTVFRVIEEEQVTTAVLLPYLLYDAMEVKVKLPESVKCVLTFGERLPRKILDFIRRKLPPTIVGFGNTESNSLCQAIVSSDCTRLTFECCPHYEIKITGDGGKILPRGQVGNIQVRSVCCMTGYFNDPEATSAVKSENGWILTGDIGIVNDNDRIEIIGRTKDVISKATTKINPQIVEDALSEHPKINKVSVVGVPDPRHFQEVCACVVPKPDAQITISELKQFANCPMLEDMFVPKYYVFFEDFPKGSTGKTDRRALAAEAAKRLNLV